MQTPMECRRAATAFETRLRHYGYSIEQPREPLPSEFISRVNHIHLDSQSKV